MAPTELLSYICTYEHDKINNIINGYNSIIVIKIIVFIINIIVNFQILLYTTQNMEVLTLVYSFGVHS